MIVWTLYLFFIGSGLDDGWLSAVSNLARTRSSSFKSLDDVQGLIISNLAEDDVLVIQPGGDDSGDEELGTVGVWSSIGHGQKSWLSVSQLEVLIGELLTIDGLATSAVATSEITTLKHELWDDAVERGALVSEPMFFLVAQGTEVLDGTWDLLIEEVEVDATGLLLDL